MTLQFASHNARLHLPAPGLSILLDCAERHSGEGQSQLGIYKGTLGVLGSGAGRNDGALGDDVARHSAIIFRLPVGWTGRLLGPPLNASRLLTCFCEMDFGSRITYQSTGSEHGGVVSEPSYLK